MEMFHFFFADSDKVEAAADGVDGGGGMGGGGD